MIGWLGAGLSCAQARPFDCVDDQQCDAAAAGRCIAPGYCAFPDASCDSGYRYHASADTTRAGNCTPLPSASAESSSGGADTSIVDGSGTTLAQTDGTASDSAGATDGPGSEDGTTETTSMPSESSDGDTNGACGDHPCACTTALASGHLSTCALRDDGSVVCWGRNQYGQLGTGDDSPPFEDIPQVINAPGATFVALTANHDHACALADDGAVWCWGRNTHGQSSPDLGTAFEMVAPTNDVTDPAIVRIEASQLSACGLDAAGSLTCWGDNNHGQLASEGDEPGPHTSGPHTASPVLGLAGGTQHMCLYTADTVMCWGRNNYGQNGSGDPGASLSTPTPVDMDIGDGVVSLAAGRFHTCAAVDGGAQVLCWGRNDCGQVDDTTEGECAQGVGGPNAYEPTPVAIPGTVVQLAARYDGTCALTDTGDAYCWGARQGYWLGTVVENGQVLQPPASIVVLIETDEPIVELSLGSQHACGRSASGRVWCWGNDEYEQLGFNDPPQFSRTVEMDLLCP